jgi:hypothetical protein
VRQISDAPQAGLSLEEMHERMVRFLAWSKLAEKHLHPAPDNIEGVTGRLKIMLLDLPEEWLEED